MTISPLFFSTFHSVEIKSYQEFYWAVSDFSTSPLWCNSPSYKIFTVSSSYKNRQNFWVLYCKYASQIPFSTSLCNLDATVPLQWTSHLQPMPWLQMIFLRAKWQIIAGNAMQLTIKSIQRNEEGMLKAIVLPCSCWDLAHNRYVYMFKEWKNLTGL